MKKIYFLMLTAIVGLSSCKNQSWEFDDYDYQTVYFAYQYPVRTLVLGEDVFDTSLDNEHKCKIMATTGGAYNNNANITIDYRVDNSICDGLKFEKGGDLLAMPSNYYSLSSDKLIIPKGDIIGGIEVTLSDEFFKDPAALTNTYVIPLVMTNAHNVDSILSGVPVVENPHRCRKDDWKTLPKDYILYAVKYINPWHGNYLRRGTDVITLANGDKQTIIRHAQYVEKDQVCNMSTKTLDSVEFPLSMSDEQGNLLDCKLILTFDDKNNITVTSDKFPASGSGKFVSKGDKKSWGNQDRDVIYLDYNLDLGYKSYHTTDTVVVRDRGVAMEQFTPVFK